MNIDNGQSISINIFRKDTLFSVDLTDSIYSFTAHPMQENINSGIFSFMADIKDMINRRPLIFHQLKDTVINKINCYNFFVKVYDTIDNRWHNYTYEKLAIDKRTLMPVYYKCYGEGNAEKGGFTIGRVNFFNEDHYSNFRTNQTIPESEFQFDKNKFSLKNDRMLSVGTIAPPMQLNDTINKIVDPVRFKNHLLLVVFGSTDCSANPLANPVLNRLNKKYDANGMAIINIYTGEKAEKVAKYIKSNRLWFPVYIGTLTTKKAYKTLGTPNFYLVDKAGKIIARFDGYSDMLEKQLTQDIDRAIRQQHL